MDMDEEVVTDDFFHVAITMDGNGRYAINKKIPILEGHRRGAENLRLITKEIPKYNVTHLTVFGFSSENWQRSDQEVNDLLNLLKEYIVSRLDELCKNNVRLRVIGNLNRFSEDLRKDIQHTIDKTSVNTGLNLTIALSYGGKEELVDAAKKIAFYAANGAITPNEINEASFEKFMYFPEMPPVDMLIRTGDVQRISNFMLWQIAYAELFFTKTMWPDFSKEELKSMIDEFKQRERRFGRRLMYGNK